MDDGRGRLEELIQGANDLRVKYLRARDKRQLVRGGTIPILTRANYKVTRVSFVSMPS